MAQRQIIARSVESSGDTIVEMKAMVMKSMKVGNIVLGEGITKICVSLIGRTEAEILREAQMIKTMTVHMVEWRADRFEGVLEVARVHKVLADIRKELNPLPILFTFRTIEEGGDRKIDINYYEKLNKDVAKLELADMIDLELFSKEKAIHSVIIQAHKHGIKILGSNHDFDKTPSKTEIINRLIKMQELGADITKIAVMPNCKKDVLTLMEAVLEMNEKYADRPIVAMSMGADGRISRLIGEFFGSAITFGAAENASAPGQIPVKDLGLVLDIIHNSENKL